MNKIGIILLLLCSSALTQAESIAIEKKDYLALVVGNYVHGFKEFDTSVTTFDDSVSIGIYYDLSSQSEARANQLAERIRKQIPSKLAAYEWAKGVKVVVNIYSEDRANRGY
ncbi:MAG: hypothetical protein DBP02_01465 [gamma proteobacterium symbiont of Ctena orbiculata]|nr:MAG: hypothetical protein DBP01_15365 [gamma proteobacterium symbiont of Ctena orbiculata]PUB87382.1 MAG: hypothetical protein DBP02_01465 [gamma proteobacterium symbiont of Ctena orbiculata]